MKKEKNKIDDIVDILLKDGNLVTDEDITECFNKLRGKLLSAMLDGELNNHLKEEESNKKNGYSSKNRMVKTANGVVKIDMPRDRDGSFDPILIKKRQRVFKNVDDAIILMYAKGMTQRDIVEIVKKTYGIEVSTSFISEVVKSVSEEVQTWMSRPLKPFYPFLYVDCIYINVKDENMISQEMPLYVIIGIDINGYKDVLSIGFGDTNSEAAYFWCNMFEDLKKRGVEDIIYVSMDGLTGLKEAINNTFPETKTQRCMVHLGRNLYKLCPKKGAKEVMADFKKIYTSSSKDEASMEFENFVNKYSNRNDTFDKIIYKVNDYMDYIMPLLEVPQEIRKIIYTTNPIESVNSAIRKVTNGKGTFPNKEAVLKVVYLRIQDLTKKWSKGTDNWSTVLNQLVLLFGERVTKYIKI